MKIVSWNINGYRGTVKNDNFQQILDLDADIICLQEIKMNDELINYPSYHVYYNFAFKRGYSGVAILTKKEAINVETKIGFEEFDQEGRFLLLEFEDFTIINLYQVNGGKNVDAYPYKLEAIDRLLTFLKLRYEKNIIICTDFNIAHQDIDVYKPKSFTNSIMFTPPERKKVDELLALGFVDSFRIRHEKEKDVYSWWSNFNMSRDRNAGWRIDYIFITPTLLERYIDTIYLTNYMGSDHCPVLLELK